MIQCPKCGAAAERQLSAGAGLLFKGEGFYITDYRSDSYRKEASEDSSSGAAAAVKDKGAGKAESTGSPKVETKASGSSSGPAGGSTSDNP